jgi:hypothetical protein
VLNIDKNNLLLCTFLIILLLVSCSGEVQIEGDPDFEGSIIELEDKKDNKYPRLLLSVDIDRYYGMEHKTDEVWISVDGKQDFNELKIGQNIKVWLNGELLESYPPQGGAAKIEVLD